MIGTIAGNDQSFRLPADWRANLTHARWLGAAQGEEHPAAVETRQFEQSLRQLGARLRTPRIGDEHSRSAARGSQRRRRMLMPEIAALGLAAEIQDRATVGEEKRAPSPPTTVGASHSACTHQLCSTSRRSADARSTPLIVCDNRTIDRNAHNARIAQNNCQRHLSMPT